MVWSVPSLQTHTRSHLQVLPVEHAMEHATATRTTVMMARKLLVSIMVCIVPPDEVQGYLAALRRYLCPGARTSPEASPQLKPTSRG
jgi:hypothetical protein